MNIAYFKLVVVLIALGGILWFVKDYKDKTQFKEDTEFNQLANERFDSLRVAYIKLTDEQMTSHIKEKEEYKKILKENNIKLNRVNSILSSVLKYRDTTIVTTDLNPILNAISKKENITQTFIDSSKCLISKGFIKYENNNLSLVFTDRIFNNETVVFGFWERKTWKIPMLGIKTKFLGKKQITAKVVDKCGESKTVIIEKQK